MVTGGLPLCDYEIKYKRDEIIIINYTTVLIYMCNIRVNIEIIVCLIDHIIISVNC